MKPKNYFTYTAPNWAEIKAVVLYMAHPIYTFEEEYVCYAQNRLFICKVHKNNKYLEKVIAEYCIIPEYDDLLNK